MAISPKIEAELKRMEQSGTAEGAAVAECLRGIAANQNDEDDIPYESDEFLKQCANEIREWVERVICNALLASE